MTGVQTCASDLKGVSDGQQVDIPVLEYVVMEGRSRLTKADEWKCLSKQ